MTTLKQEIINLVAEIKGWNDREISVCENTKGISSADIFSFKARAKVIKKLQDLVNKPD